MIIQLDHNEVRVCTLLAVERWLMKHESVDKPNYAEGKKAGRLEHELLANVRANVSEYAVAKHYNQSWNVPWYPNILHPFRKDLPDVGVDGEVRTVRTADGIPYWYKDMKKVIIGTKILDEDYYSTVEIFGHFRAKDYMSETYRDESINGWRMPVDILKELA